MKEFLIIVFVAISTSSSPVSNNEVDYTSMYEYGRFDQEFPAELLISIINSSSVQADKTDLKIYFYSKSTKETEVDLSDPASVQRCGYAKSKDTVFIIHGWESDVHSPMCQDVKDAYLASTDVNVFVSDWSKISKSDYATARAAVGGVGKLLASMISGLVNKNLLNLNNVVIVGHSLGAHVAGCTGKNLNGQTDTIIGLDPAGPLFNIGSDHLTTSDAKYVQVIHTCATKLGIKKNLGHADFWPNGGHEQPGCPLDVTGTCSHARSYKFFAESLKTGNFVSWKCTDYETFKSGKCNSNSRSYIGTSKIDKTAQGDYFLSTNAAPPYAKGNHQIFP